MYCLFADFANVVFIALCPAKEKEFDHTIICICKRGFNYRFGGFANEGLKMAAMAGKKTRVNKIHA